MANGHDPYNWSCEPIDDAITLFGDDLRKIRESAGMIDRSQERLERDLEMKFRQLVRKNADAWLPLLDAKNPNELSPIGHVFASTLKALHGAQHGESLAIGCETSIYSDEAKNCNQNLIQAVHKLRLGWDGETALIKQLHGLVEKTLESQQTQRI